MSDDAADPTLTEDFGAGGAAPLHGFTLTVIDADAPAVGPSAEAVIDGSYQPLSRPIFIYVNAKSAKERPHVSQFVEYYLSHAVPLIKEVKYIPLPDSAYDVALANFKANKTGTVFAGHAEIGVRIEDLLKREAR